jgi:L-amino acid N-acyltransferase YncA
VATPIPTRASTAATIRKFRSESTTQCYERNVNATSDVSIRRAEAGDAARIAEIYNQGLEDRLATFETQQATRERAEEWIAESLVLVLDTDETIAGWAKAGPYTDHAYYEGVREATLYVARESRRYGIGRALLEGLAKEAAADGAHKLVGKIFTSNEPSIALVRGLGWREVGTHLRHGELDGEWRDVLVVEKLLDRPE